jgi:hypothetical protein
VRAPLLLALPSPVAGNEVRPGLPDGLFSNQKSQF